jgi:homospermidine synthase
MPLASYPSGFLVLHEENLTLGQALGVSSKFIYALHPKTMAYLARRWRRRGQLRVTDLKVGDNTVLPLDGADTIGVCLEYPRRRVYYLHSLANSAVVGANATCMQVAVGVYAALFTLLREPLAPRLYFVSDLYDTVYPQVLFANMRVEHFIFAKRKRSLILRHHEPALRPRFPHAEEQMVI